jgi:succinate-semialdehyde dehydrogenase/glutarate-semialdehyde dehydrogenase
LKGARVLCGGERHQREGYWIQPTILADVNDEMECQCGEIFGPILCVRPFDSVDEAFERANDSELGLSGYVYTQSLAISLRAETELQCGNICINGAHYSIELPHGGLKQSGYGKDISHLSLRDYYDIKRVSIKR